LLLELVCYPEECNGQSEVVDAAKLSEDVVDVRGDGLPVLHDGLARDI
jgi:hypothetical protein